MNKVNSKEEDILRHIKTHTVSENLDELAVTTLKDFICQDGRINPAFKSGDKWPNTDGTFEFVSNPSISRRPEQNFFVQIKGTHTYEETEKEIKYSLKSLAFPAFI